MRVETDADLPFVETGAPEVHCEGIARVEIVGSTVKFVAYSCRVLRGGMTERRDVVTLAMPIEAFPGGRPALRERWGAVLVGDKAEVRPVAN